MREKREMNGQDTRRVSREDREARGILKTACFKR